MNVFPKKTCLLSILCFTSPATAGTYIACTNASNSAAPYIEVFQEQEDAPWSVEIFNALVQKSLIATMHVNQKWIGIGTKRILNFSAKNFNLDIDMQRPQGISRYESELVWKNENTILSRTYMCHISLQ